MLKQLLTQIPVDASPQAFERSTSHVDDVAEALVTRALAAQRQIEGWSEDRIDALLRALSNVIVQHAHALAVSTVAETGMGNVRDKTLKNYVASAAVYAQLAGQIGYGEIAFDGDRQVAEIASPVGVVVGLVPATHPVGDVRLQGPYRAQRPERHHPEPQPAGTAGLATDR